MKLLKLLGALVLFSGLAYGQATRPGCTPSNVLAASGTCTVANANGAYGASFEEIPSGSPTSVSITIQGCMNGGTCDTAADTNTSTTATVRGVTFSKVYDYYKITAGTLSGGTSPKMTVNPTLSTANNHAAGSSFTAGGDLAGTSTSQEVTGILSNPLPALSSGNLNWSGSAWQFTAGGTGTVTTFSAGTLSPLFTTSVATATTTPALTFSLSTASADQLFGNPTGSTAAPEYFGVTSPLAFSSSALGCATCVTSSGSLTSNALVTGAGSQGSQTPSSTSTLSSAGVMQLAAGGSVGSADTGTPTFTFTTNKVSLNQPLYHALTTNQIVTGTSTNLTTLNFPASSGAVTLTFPVTTEYMVGANSDTTTSHVLHATSVAGVFNSAAIATGDLPTGIPIGNVGTSGLSATLPLAITAAGAISTSSITGFRYGTASAADTAATAAQLGTLANIAQYSLHVSAGTTSAIGGIAPSSTSGAIFASAGSSANPAYDANAVVSAGGLTLGASGTAGTIALYPASGNFQTNLGSVATATNTVDFFASVPTNLHTFYCAVSSTTCTLTDSGYAYNSIPTADLAATGTFAFNNAVNTGTSAMTLNMSASTSAPSVQLPAVVGGTILAGTSTANLSAPIVIQNTNSTNNNTSITLGVTAPGTSTGQTVLNVNGAATGGDLADFGTGGSWSAGVLSGQTIVAKIGVAGALSLGSSAPACSGSGVCITEAANGTNVSSAAMINANSTTHELAVATNGATTFGQLVRTQPADIDQTSQTGSISTATLCAASAGACNVAGQYRINANFWGSGTACSSVTAGSVALTITWTDETGTAHSAIGFPMWDQSKSAMETSFYFNTALGTEGAGGSWIISTNGSVIQYATTYTACSTGTGTYNLRLTAERVR